MSRKLLVGTVLLGAGILCVVFRLSKPDSVYSRSVSEFVAHPVYDRTVRVQGTVVPGSVCWRAEPCEYRFLLVEPRDSPTDAAAMAPPRPGLSVRYPSCIVPDTFRPKPGTDTFVTVEGKQCASCHYFEASLLLARGPGKYEMRARDAGSEPPPEPVTALAVCPES